MYGNTARWSHLFWFEGSCACVLGFRLHSASCPAGIWTDCFGFDLGHCNVYGLYTLWLELSLLKSPRHLFDRVIVLYLIKDLIKFATSIHTQLLLNRCNVGWDKTSVAECTSMMASFETHLIPSAHLRRQHAPLELQNFRSQLQLPILSSLWVYIWSHSAFDFL